MCVVQLVLGVILGCKLMFRTQWGSLEDEHICTLYLPARFCFECFHVSVATGCISGQKLMFSIYWSSLEGE